MMKKIGQSINSNLISMSEGFIISENDVQREFLLLRDHEIGLFRRMYVLIKWINYFSDWKNVSLEQQAIMMSFKVEAFSNKTKPAGIRTLDCVDAFEHIDNKAEYAFLYRISICDFQVDIDSSTATLRQLLKKKKQPLLSDKLRLASALGQFLKDFHNTDWLHESFHSNNILFFNIKNSEQGNSFSLALQELKQSYVVGLYRSRLGGKEMHTADSIFSNAFQDYQHPEYARTKRYRPAYDYYSLGLILLKLGHWQPLCKMTRSLKYQKMGLEEIRQDLLQTRVPLLGIKTGAVYRNAVDFCLSGIMNSSKNLNKNNLNTFAKNVLEPLKDLTEIYIWFIIFKYVLDLRYWHFGVFSHHSNL